MDLRPNTRPFRRRWALAGLLLASAAAALGALWLHTRLVSAALFLRMEGGKSGPAWLVHYAEHEVDERAFALASGIPATLYTPRAVAEAPGLVLAHGIHDEGIREPRFTRLARAIASTGVTVLTPELSDLVRYRVSRAGVETIAAATRELAASLGQARVAVFGISFGGGLALRAACEPALASAMGRVITLGAHHDAAAVVRFFLGDAARAPDGRRVALAPHSYGATILFAWLFDEPHRGGLSAADASRVRGALARRKAELDAASPAYCRAPLSLPLHLAHGLGDNIVPYTETLWNTAKFAAEAELDVLVSPVLGHAEYAPPSLWQRFQLVDFMARALP
jgi:alpha-beta hydrolase superfamily lysophospholipase